MLQEIKIDLKKALQERDKLKVSVLRMVLSILHNKEIEKKEITEEEINQVLFSEIKKRKEAIEQYQKGGREELVEKEKKELDILKKYIPEQLSEEEIKKIVKEAIKETGAETMKDMGKVMGKIMPKLKGKADGSLVNKTVQELLN